MAASVVETDIKNVILELVFVLTNENSLFSYLGVLALVIDYLQMCAFGLTIDANWNVSGLQHAMDYFILPWQVNTVSLWIVLATVMSTMSIVIVLFRQVAIYGVITSTNLLKAARILFGLCSTILFFPFVETMLGALVTSDPSSATFIVTVILLSCFFLFILAFSGLYICPDLLSKEDPTLKISTRAELFDISGRFAIPLASYLLNTWGFFVVYCLVVAATLTLNLFYPYYVRVKLNYLRAGMLGSLLLLGLIGFSVANNGDDISQTRFYLALGLMPVVGLLSSLVSFGRLRMFDITLMYQITSKIDLYEFNPEAVIARCFYPTDVELATRFSLIPSRHTMLSQYSVLCLAIFEEGVKKFPNSLYLRARYVIYMVFVTLNFGTGTSRGDGASKNDARKFTKSITTKIQTQIDFMNKQKIPLDLEYCLFYIVTKLDRTEIALQSGEDRVGLMDSIRFRHDLASARMHHTRSLNTLHSFWTTLRDEVAGDDNVWQLAFLIERYHSHNNRADFYYSRIVEKFPNSMLSHKYYALFLRDSDRNEAAAQAVEAMLFQFNHIEDAADKAKSNSRLVLNRDVSAQMESAAVMAYEDLNATFRKNKKTDRKKPAFYRTATNLTWYMFLSVVLMMVGAIVIFLVSSSQYRTVTVPMANPITNSHKIAYLARQLEISDTFGMSDTDTTSTRNFIRTLAADLSTKIAKIRSESIAYLGLDDTWLSIDITTLKHYPNGTAYIVHRDLAHLANLYINSAYTLSNDSFSTARQTVAFNQNATHRFIGDADWSYLVDNADLVSYHTGLINLGIASHNLASTAADKKTLSIMLAVVLTVPLCMALFVALPLFLGLLRERRSVFRLFSLLSKEAAISMAVKFQICKSELSEKSDGASERTASSSNVSDTGSQVAGTGSFSAFEKLRKYPTWITSGISYIFALVILTTIIIVNSTIVNQAGDVISSLDTAIGYSAIRETGPLHLLTLSQELIRADAYIHPSMSEFSDYIRSYYDEAYYVHESLMYGNSSIGLSGSAGVYADQDQLAYEMSCTDYSKYECRGMDELYSEFLNLIDSLLSKDIASLTLNDPIFQKIRYLAQGPLTAKLFSSTSLYRQAIIPAIDEVYTVQGIVFGVSFPVAIIEISFLFWILKRIKAHTDSTVKVMSMVPYEHISKVSAFIRYLRKGVVRDIKTGAWNQNDIQKQTSVDKQIEMDEDDDVFDDNIIVQNSSRTNVRNGMEIKLPRVISFSAVDKVVQQDGTVQQIKSNAVAASSVLTPTRSRSFEIRSSAALASTLNDNFSHKKASGNQQQQKIGADPSVSPKRRRSFDSRGSRMISFSVTAPTDVQRHEREPRGGSTK